MSISMTHRLAFSFSLHLIEGDNHRRRSERESLLVFTDHFYRSCTDDLHDLVRVNGFSLFLAIWICSRRVCLPVMRAQWRGEDWHGE